MIYNYLEKSSERTRRFVSGWAKLNPAGLKRFGIGAEDFNDRYVDFITDEPKTKSQDQLSLWLSIAYKQASDEIGSAVGRKTLSSTRPRARGETPLDRFVRSNQPRPVTGRGTVTVDRAVAQVTQVLTTAISDLRSGKTLDWNRLAQDIAQASGHRQPTDQLVQKIIRDLKADGYFGIRGYQDIKPSNIQYVADVLVKK